MEYKQKTNKKTIKPIWKFKALAYNLSTKRKKKKFSAFIKIFGSQSRQIISAPALAKITGSAAPQAWLNRNML